jgi:hypothetical protein
VNVVLNRPKIKDPWASGNPWAYRWRVCAEGGIEYTKVSGISFRHILNNKNDYKEIKFYPLIDNSLPIIQIPLHLAIDKIIWRHYREKRWVDTQQPHTAHPHFAIEAMGVDVGGREFLNIVNLATGAVDMGVY